MTPNEYQKLANRTLIDRPDFFVSDDDTMLTWNALGLTGEAGEVADSIKKMIYHQHGLEPDKLREELGDVLWYIAAISTNLGFTLEEVMAENIAKLQARYPEGYNSDASKNREINE